MSAPFGLLNNQPVFGPLSPTPDIAYWDQPTYGIALNGEIWFNGTGPTYSKNPWDIVVIGGMKVPGICKVRACPALAFDQKHPAGADGDVITVHGRRSATVDIDVVIWTQDQWSKLQVLVPNIWRKPGKKDKTKDLALTISHSAIDLLGINAVVIVSVSVPDAGPIPQSKVIKIKCVEFIPVTNANQTKTAKLAVPVPEDPRTVASSALGEDPPSVTDLGPDGPGKSTIPGG